MASVGLRAVTQPRRLEGLYGEERPDRGKITRAVTGSGLVGRLRAATEQARWRRFIEK